MLMEVLISKSIGATMVTTHEKRTGMSKHSKNEMSGVSNAAPVSISIVISFSN